MIKGKQEKLCKRFHKNIDEFAVSRPQKKKKKKEKKKVQILFANSITDINSKYYWNRFSKIQRFSRGIRPEMLLKKRKKIAKFTGSQESNAGVGVSFL